MQKPPRPGGVTVLAILELLAAIVLLGGGALFFVAASLIGSSSFASQYPNFSSYSTGTLTDLLYVTGAIAIVLGLLSLVVGVGFLSGKSWVWTFAIVVGIINIVSTIAEIATGFSAPTSAIGIIFQIIIIYYLMRPNVKAYFGKGTAPAPAMVPPGPSQ